MMPVLTACADALDRGRGLARDIRLRWACAGLGLAHDERLVPWQDVSGPAHLVRQPFAQIPAWEEGDLAIFESGAIVLHPALTHPGLLPADAGGRARALRWLMSALDTVEPPLVEWEMAAPVESGTAPGLPSGRRCSRNRRAGGSPGSPPHLAGRRGSTGPAVPET